MAWPQPKKTRSIHHRGHGGHRGRREVFGIRFTGLLPLSLPPCSLCAPWCIFRDFRKARKLQLYSTEITGFGWRRDARAQDLDSFSVFSVCSVVTSSSASALTIVIDLFRGRDGGSRADWEKLFTIDSSFFGLCLTGRATFVSRPIQTGCAPATGTASESSPR